jgi:hypothetical protein
VLHLILGICIAFWNLTQKSQVKTEELNWHFHRGFQDENFKPEIPIKSPVKLNEFDLKMKSDSELFTKHVSF